MKFTSAIFTVFFISVCFSAFAQGGDEYPADYARAPRFKALLCYDPSAEEAHVQFAKQAVQFFHKLTYGEGYILDVTTNFAEYAGKLDDYSTLIMINYSIKGEEQRKAFEAYMEHGGGWIGFHAAAYNDRGTNWPWFNQFLGCGTFLCNQWPPQAALIDIDSPDHVVTRTLPGSFIVPASEFYQWQPSPRESQNVEVLASISPKMYPFGIKDIVKRGDFPIVWTNKNYRMIYLNMGHGDESFIDATQNLLFTNAFRWVVSRDPRVDLGTDRVVVAYVTSWTETIPDPTVMTHLNYAFGHVNESFNGVGIDNADRLRQMVSLKQQNPHLKVLLSIGGWGSGRFSEMASSDRNRKKFAKDCLRVVKEFGLDGIDIDWEYPTQSSAGISSSPDDTKNYTLLMRDLRAVLGSDLLLTCATVCSAQYIDFKSCVQYLDLVNTMSYDMGNPPIHHSALYPSDITGEWTASQCIEAHIAAGVPRSKLVMGMPLYGRGLRGSYNTAQEERRQTEERWSEQSQVPYLVNAQGELVMSFENERSIGLKCQYIISQGLRGGMYWEYGGAREEPLRNTVSRWLLDK